MLRIDRIRDLMTVLEYSQAGLAKAAGCTQGAVQQVLAGTTRRSRYLPEMAAALGTTVEYLTGSTDGLGDGGNRAGSPAATSSGGRADGKDVTDHVETWIAVRDRLAELRPEWSEASLNDAASSILAARTPLHLEEGVTLRSVPARR